MLIYLVAFKNYYIKGLKYGKKLCRLFLVFVLVVESWSLRNMTMYNVIRRSKIFHIKARQCNRRKRDAKTGKRVRNQFVFIVRSPIKILN